MNALKHWRKISDCAIIGTMSALVLVSLNACSSEANDNTAISQAAKQGAFVIIEKDSAGNYKILEEHPSDTTRILLREPDGTERMLSQQEIDSLMQAESKKIDEGTSQLTNPTGGGLSLGEAILASAAGAIIGSWIGSKLFNNNNFANQQRGAYSSPQAYERSQNIRQGATSTRATGTPTTGRSGFYGGGSSSNQNTGGSSSGIGG